MSTQLMRNLAPVWLAAFLCFPGCHAQALPAEQPTSIDRKAAPATDPIPAFSLAITCGGQKNANPHLLTPEETRSLAGFVSFIEDHQDSVVYVSARIDQECASCGCPRSAVRDVSEQSDGYGADGRRGTLTIDARSDVANRDAGIKQGWGSARMVEEGLLLEANGVENWSGRQEIYLPKWKHLTDAHYRAGEYGTFATFDGLFTARFHGRTGVNLLYLDVLSPSVQQQAQLHRLRADAGN